ncbi:hypothetical protein BDW02DRAFT_297597 [Decorospora gaudefroyi]|uniref:Uncharacterized protein n=1 Tax=Decorospora gaudefroyi TaxID=184978 RepID=A0A6A5KBG6_9PLEO|nr:hypothetical protein BDW02DRAFT_297597 [Decorospora gaudefroyi]
MCLESMMRGWRAHCRIRGRKMGPWQHLGRACVILQSTQEGNDVRDWLFTESKSLGREMEIDQMGNVLAIRPMDSLDDELAHRNLKSSLPSTQPLRKKAMAHRTPEPKYHAHDHTLLQSILRLESQVLPDAAP